MYNMYKLRKDEGIAGFVGKGLTDLIPHKRFWYALHVVSVGSVDHIS